jgi:hypothetical protein
VNVWIMYYTFSVMGMHMQDVIMVFSTQRGCEQSRQNQIDMHIDKAAMAAHLVCVKEEFDTR